MTAWTEFSVVSAVSSSKAAAAGQVWSAKGYARNARFVADLGENVLAWLAPKSGEHILDLGCGDGALTEKIAASGAFVTGFDASVDLIKAAKARGLDVQRGDGHALPYKQRFDAVFSNAALHWMLKPDEVLDGVAKSLKPSGRFVGEFGGFGNVAAVTTALRVAVVAAGVDGLRISPWYFPTVSEYGAKLHDHGFEVGRIELIPRPTPLPTGMQGWLATFAAPFLQGVPKAKQAQTLARTIEFLRPSLCDTQGQWIADYVRLRFEATLAA